jgi:tetratricopeptide (TPR) repeat protein
LAWRQRWRTPDCLRLRLGRSSSGVSALVSGLTACSRSTRERWGIPDYREDLVLAEDFRDGLLWRFRDHSTAFSDNMQAKTWFLCSPEARFVQQYDFEGGLEGQGPYKALVEREVAWGLPGSISVLDSPVFGLGDYRRLGSDPAFAKAQQELQWALRDAHARGGDLELLEPRPEADVVCDLARLSLYQGAPDQAQTYLDRALELDQASWEAWYYLGITCAISGQRDRAAGSFRQAAKSVLELERDPTDPWYRVRLVTDQLQIYGQAIQRLGAAALETMVPARPPPPPKASQWALLRLVDGWHAEAVPSRGIRSPRPARRTRRQSKACWLLDRKLVMAAPKVLHQAMPGQHDRGTAVLFEAAHRP